MIPMGHPNAFKQVTVKCQNDRFENMIREIGVVNACEWFGHSQDSLFVKETIEHFIGREFAEFK